MEDKRKKSGMISVEIALVLALSLVALFIVVGIFSDSTKMIATNSNFQNILQQDNTAKTHFETYNRDYSESQDVVK